MRLRSLVRRAIRSFWVDPAKARYHFIHIPKNAGEAVRDALYFQRDISLSTPFHYRYIDVADSVGRNLRYFAVVRNPWSRTASRYHFARQNAVRWPADDPRRQYISGVDFAGYVKERRIFSIPEHPHQPWMGPLSSWFNQLEWIRDDNGNVACDCLRMERLDHELESYLGRRLGLQKRNVTRARFDYRDMYTSELVDIVGSYFREDIEHFGFHFDGPATRNVVFEVAPDP